MIRLIKHIGSSTSPVSNPTRSRSTYHPDCISMLFFFHASGLLEIVIEKSVINHLCTPGQPVFSVPQCSVVLSSAQECS